jgi:hypothetical protein
VSRLSSKQRRARQRSKIPSESPPPKRDWASLLKDHLQHRVMTGLGDYRSILPDEGGSITQADLEQCMNELRGGI